MRVCVCVCVWEYVCLPSVPSHSVLVLGAGKVLEYASPTELLANSSSVFYSMAKDAGLVPSKDGLVSSEDASKGAALTSSKDADLVA